MLYVEKHYLMNSRRDLISKLNYYKNINEVTSIKSINLEFIGFKHKTVSILGLCFFYLFLGLQGKAGFFSGKNLKKTMFCNLNLFKNKDIFLFLEKYIFILLYNHLNLDEKFKNSSLSNTGTFSFVIKDIFKFLELEENLFRFRSLKNLKISFVFTSQDRDANLKLLKSLGFKFKN
jgi:hypothetical protein